MNDHFKIRVRGKVQGVFFRSSAHNEAVALGLRGFVRNEPDGSVYIEAEGDQHALARFVEWCKKGPPRSRVEHVEVVEGQVHHYEKFEIRR
jgi:acylphosphatase